MPRAWIGLALMLTSMLGGTAQAAEATPLLEAVHRAENAASFHSTQGTQEGIQRARLCVDSVNTALAGGAAPTDLVSVDGRVPGAVQTKNQLGFWIKVAPLSAIKLHCEGLLGRQQFDQVSGELRKYENWAATSEHPSHQGRAYIDLDLRWFAACNQVVDRALTAALSPEIQIKLAAGSIALADAKDKVCNRFKVAADKLKTRFPAQAAVASPPSVRGKKSAKASSTGSAADRPSQSKTDIDFGPSPPPDPPRSH